NLTKNLTATRTTIIVRCSLNCSLDNLFRDEMYALGEAYTNLRVEIVPAFRYIRHAVISADPEGDALNRMFAIARDNGVDKPRIIGWDFPHLS
ncbi:MAG: hypothetical protein NC237_13140, partial [Eubacterium sp.]|nr:hypothetical protein [Eubacterium sp.]